MGVCLDLPKVKFVENVKTHHEWKHRQTRGVTAALVDFLKIQIFEVLTESTWQAYHDPLIIFLLNLR